jgi:rare lipoprotein A (peptidoglycan hydrolase)
VRRRLVQREVALAGVALLGAAVSLAVTSKNNHHGPVLPAPEGSYTALAGSSGSAVFGKKTACGIVIDESTVGVANPVLRCGVRLYIGYRGRKVLTEVIGHGPSGPGRQFDLSAALARELGLAGVKRIQWNYAAAG